MADILYELLLHAIHFEEFSVRRFRLFIGPDRLVVETAVFKRKGELIGERPQDPEILCAVFLARLFDAQRNKPAQLLRKHERDQEFGLELRKNRPERFLTPGKLRIR